MLGLIQDQTFGTNLWISVKLHKSRTDFCSSVTCEAVLPWDGGVDTEMTPYIYWYLPMESAKGILMPGDVSSFLSLTTPFLVW